MLDDNKHTEAVKAFFTEREFHDLCKLAIKDDRKPGELLRVIARRYMYGNVGADVENSNGANSAGEGSN